MSSIKHIWYGVYSESEGKSPMIVKKLRSDLTLLTSAISVLFMKLGTDYTRESIIYLHNTCACM